MAETPRSSPAPTRDQVDAVEEAFRQLQDRICSFLEQEGGQRFQARAMLRCPVPCLDEPYHHLCPRLWPWEHSFLTRWWLLVQEDKWTYNKGSGGGRTRVFEVDRHAPVPEGGWALCPTKQPLPMWERGACNFSGICGASMPASAAQALKIPSDQEYRATGVSLIVHPSNPWVPTIHMNVRFFICGDRWWFGGGVDLTPYYPILRQVKAFHKLLHDLCVAHGVSYDSLKAQCDSYFLLPHRNETRGIGGLFYDTMSEDFEAAKAFAIALGDCFLQLYGLFVNNAKMSFTQAQREFQLYRRGRYVEFNLLYDRGTKFGLSSEGRIESILVSLPATVHYCYDYNPPRGSREEYLYLHFLRPQPWLELTAEDDARMKSPPNYVTTFLAKPQTMPSDSGSPAPSGGSGLDSGSPKGPTAEPQGHFGSLTQATAVVAGAAAIAGVLRYLRA